MRILLLYIEIVKCYLCLVLNHCLGGPQLPCLRHGTIEGPAMFANIKKNKCLQFNDLLFFGDFINTVQDSAV